MQLADIQEARARIAGQVAFTPCPRSATLSAMTGADLYLKFENLQFTASFKERGALNCLLQLREAEAAKGVIAMSAGNHAQALAYHGQRLGIPTTIVMPRYTPNAKVAQTRVFNAEVILHGSQFDETLAFTNSLAAERELVLVHPYDDPRVMAGQGTVALEMLEQIPGLEVVLVSVGGGGLISGMATAIKSLAPSVEVIGVQMKRFPAVFDAFHGVQSVGGPPSTVAEGIAVATPGANTVPIIRRLVDDMVLVDEEEVEQGIFNLLEIEKTLVEGAGAASLAALFADEARFRNRRTGLVLCGGNLDMMILSSVLQRGLVRSHRLVQLQVEIPDVPGALAQLTAVLADLESNIVDIQHQRTFGVSSVRASRVALVLQMRGEEQIDQVVDALAERGYEASFPG
jgi:threonine dehydratase